MSHSTLSVPSSRSGCGFRGTKCTQTIARLYMRSLILMSQSVEKLTTCVPNDYTSVKKDVFIKHGLNNFQKAITSLVNFFSPKDPCIYCELVQTKSPPPSQNINQKKPLISKIECFYTNTGKYMMRYLDVWSKDIRLPLSPRVSLNTAKDEKITHHSAIVSAPFDFKLWRLYDL